MLQKTGPSIDVNRQQPCHHAFFNNFNAASFLGTNSERLSAIREKENVARSPLATEHLESIDVCVEQQKGGYDMVEWMIMQQEYTTSVQNAMKNTFPHDFHFPAFSSCIGAFSMLSCGCHKWEFFRLEPTTR